MNVEQIINGAKAIIFDVDGLLLDTEKIWDKSHPKFIEKHKLQDDPRLYDEAFGTGIYDVIQMYQPRGLKGNINDLVVEYRETFYEILSQPGNLQVMPGAKKLIHILHEQNKELAIATGGHTKGKIREFLTQLNLDPYFSLIVSSDEVAKGKPAPDVYLYTADKLRVAADDCLVLEDSPNGVMAGKAAGMIVFGVNPHALIRKRLEESEADIVFSSLEEIVNEL